jgi:hypothetical protein
MGSIIASQSVFRSGSSGGPRWFRKKKKSEFISDTERMKNTPIRVCAKTAFVG